MRKILFYLLFFTTAAVAQTPLPHFADSLFTTYYHQRVTHFRALPDTEGDVIFLGNSISDGAEWSELFNDLNVKNRGISGDITAGVLHRLDEVYKRNPAKVFLLIGTNDLARGIRPDSVAKNILWIADLFRDKSPETQLYVQSLLPVNKKFGKFSGHTDKKEQILTVNNILKKNAPAKKYLFLNLYPAFSDSTGSLNTEYTNDGLHLTGKGYQKWKQLIYSQVYNTPSLLPLPQELQWSQEKFQVSECKSIVIGSSSLKNEALKLQQYLKTQGISVPIKINVTPADPYIELRLGETGAPHLREESYTLSVSTNKITLIAPSAHGIFNGLQTLKQLKSDGSFQGCKIADWPAFAFRGYMADVGRNYQSMPLLLEQLDVMASYKLNVFQFHLTEDIAWRLQVKKYPELTEAKHMIRNKGKFYSEKEIKQLIAYCKERHITFIPEIDMPGHSAAFERAMGVDMQTDKGLAIVKEIIKEFCETYDVAYLHLGGDEVKITNEKFLPEVIRYAESFGKKVIGWDPGGNISNSTIRQLWMGDKKVDNQYQFIDSRHLYLNHMDPLESVTSIFHRKIGDRAQSDTNLLGGILCLWHDRNVNDEKDLFTMNPVYPGILTFAERSWLGGGHDTWITNIHATEAEKLADFDAFEQRLLEHKIKHFAQKPFPYVKQSNLEWELYGPYPNDGNLGKVFPPEEIDFSKTRQQPRLQVAGATVVLRHWWAPMVKGAISTPQENTTWYARTEIWSDSNAVAPYWIGFNNLSRSYFSDAPALNTWDTRQSSVWINRQLIAPPRWERAGQKGNSEVPLTDEGYEYRKPTMISVKKGWNTILVKLPVGAFKGSDWQNPVKWMFTVAPYSDSISNYQ